MGNIKIVKGTGKVDLATCREVDMDEWAYSASFPLATIGALPCMVVVVHNPAKNEGCLTHIWNVAYDQENLDVKRSFERHELYHKACFSILDMIKNGIGSKGSFQLWLGAGTGFTMDSPKVKDTTHYDFPVYVTRFLAEAGCDVEIIDDRKGKNTGDVIYWPPTDTIYLMDEMEDIFAVQTKKKAVVTGKCR